MFPPNKSETHYSSITPAEEFQAIAIGPGLGQHYDSLEALKEQLTYCKHPVIVDADGINLLARYPEMICRLPIGSILTPHEGELDRLLGSSQSRKERIEKARRWCRVHKSYIILKGAFTTVVAPNGHLFFNSTGNPGMATAGSGDVLTGILLGLLSQGYAPLKSCLIAVYVHGLSGDLVTSQKTQMALIASDIIAYLPAAWKKLSVK
ncbi:MAG: NAD(P)H-hydrate dehydratase [Bacteroidaceae bacterium]